jgi:hypothetical protein
MSPPGEDARRRRRRRFLAVVGPWIPRLLLAVTAAFLAVALWHVLQGAGGLP